MEKEQDANLKKLACIIDNHDSQPLNMICIDKSCKSKRLICIECMDDNHSGHRTTTLKKFLNILSEFDSKETAGEAFAEEVEALEYDLRQNLEIIHKNGNDLIERMNSFQENMKRNMITLAEQINKQEKSILDSLLTESPKKLITWLLKTFREKEITNELTKSIELNINVLCQSLTTEESLKPVNTLEILSGSKLKVDEYGKFLKNLKSLFMKRLSQIESQFPVIFSPDGIIQGNQQTNRSISTQTEATASSDSEGQSLGRPIQARFGSGSGQKFVEGKSRSGQKIKLKPSNNSPKTVRLQAKYDKIIIKDREFSYVKIQDPLYIGSEEVSCAFCHKSSRKVKQLKILGKVFGPFLYNNNREVYFVHELCALWTSGIYIDDRFSIQNTLLNEVKRASRLRCALCKASGAGVGCSVKNCSSTFHFKCILSRQARCRVDYEQFSIHCEKHRSLAQVKSDESDVYYDSSSVLNDEIIQIESAASSTEEQSKKAEKLKEIGETKAKELQSTNTFSLISQPPPRPESKYLKLKHLAEQESIKIEADFNDKELNNKSKKSIPPANEAPLNPSVLTYPSQLTAENKENTKDLFNALNSSNNNMMEEISSQADGTKQAKRKRNESKESKKEKKAKKKSKQCLVCTKSSGTRGNSLIQCKDCGCHYHFLCHTPPIVEKPKKRKEWRCGDCRLQLVLRVDKGHQNAASKTEEFFNKEKTSSLEKGEDEGKPIFKGFKDAINRANSKKNIKKKVYDSDADEDSDDIEEELSLQQRLEKESSSSDWSQKSDDEVKGHENESESEEIEYMDQVQKIKELYASNNKASNMIIGTCSQCNQKMRIPSEEKNLARHYCFKCKESGIAGQEGRGKFAYKKLFIEAPHNGKQNTVHTKLIESSSKESFLESEEEVDSEQF